MNTTTLGSLPTTTPSAKVWTRNSQSNVVGGVCSGIAQRFDIDPWLVRLLFVATLALPVVSVIIYIALWIALPWDFERARKAGASADSVALSWRAPDLASASA